MVYSSVIAAIQLLSLKCFHSRNYRLEAPYFNGEILIPCAFAALVFNLINCPQHIGDDKTFNSGNSCTEVILSQILCTYWVGAGGGQVQWGFCFFFKSKLFYYLSNSR